MITARKFLSVIMVLYAQAAFAQATYTIDDFSPDYRATVYVAKPDEVFSSGWISIEDKKTKKELLKVTSGELAIDAEKGKVTSNIRELPYGRQSVIQYEDFNFDGIKDLAIEDGQESCYHGPSFTVYLGNERGFKPSKEFTDLAHNYCGMFNVNAKEKTISTMTKSGCCWHQSSLYKIKDGLPYTVEIHAEKFELGNVTEITEKWDGHKMVTKQTRTIDKRDVKSVLDFVLQDNGKEVFLFTAQGDNNLNYAFINTKGHIELAFPQDSKSDAPLFKLTQSSDSVTLSFKNGAEYVIKESASGKMTLYVTVNGKTTHYTQGNAKKSGTLKTLLLDIPSNVQFNNAN